MCSCASRRVAVRHKPDVPSLFTVCSSCHGVHRGFTALHCAARYGHSDIADTICILHKILDEVDHLSWINLPDMYAAPALLFSHSSPARVVIAPASYGSTPLILAARCGHLATVTALLRHDATASDGLLATISHYAQLPIPAVSHTSFRGYKQDGFVAAA